MADFEKVDLDRVVDYRAEYAAVIEKYKISGDNLTGLCPFHRDKQNSFSADLTTGQWHCFSEDEGGNFVTFWAKYHNVDTKQAYKEILEKYGVAPEKKPEKKQAEKKAARQAALDRIGKMNRNELLKASVERVAADTERLTRRNMKEAVAEHVQAKCREDASFAMLVMAPEKSMIRCFRYISRQAQKYAEQEMKDNGIQRTGIYGLDVPDGLCYQWAEDYFNDENAEEDHKDDEKFVPKPYVSTNRKAAKSKTDKKPSPAAKPKAEKPKAPGMEQLTLGVM